MITVSDVSVGFSGQDLFSHVNLLFTPGNCYGVIGANGAGKSTFLKVLSGELEPTKGDVSIDPKCRMSVLKQDHFAYEEFTVLDTIMQGNQRLYDVMKQKDELYAKPDFSEEDGHLAAELEAEFAEMNGWDARQTAARSWIGNRYAVYANECINRKRKGKGTVGKSLVRPARYYSVRRTDQRFGY